MTTEKTSPIVDEVAWAQVEGEPIVTINVTLTPVQLGALCRYVDRIIEENLSKPNLDRDELDAIQAVRDAWPYRWREPNRFP
jgi:hypothetical protein